MVATPANDLNVTSAGLVKFDGTATFSGVTTTNHNLLIGATSNGITNVAPSATSGVPVISQGASADPTFGTAVVAGGGTGATSLTAHSLLLGQGTSAITALGAATNGQIPIGSTGADPVLATLSADSSTSLTITNGAGSITIKDFAVQQQRTQLTSFSRLNGAFPADNTIPQNTEGVEVTTVSITPKNSNNKLVIQALITFSAASAGSPTICLFQDSTANALACSWGNAQSTNITMQVALNYTMTAGTTSSTTFKIRIGNTGSAQNFDINGFNNASLLGGVLTSYLQVTEYTS